MKLHRFIIGFQADDNATVGALRHTLIDILEGGAISHVTVEPMAPDGTRGITAPVVNLNGSDAATLLADAFSAVAALINAEELLAKTAPRPRDFQTVHHYVFTDAVQQHKDRTARLSAIRAEMEAIAASLGWQMGKRGVVLFQLQDVRLLRHASDCALHGGPAKEPAPCDCGASAAYES